MSMNILVKDGQITKKTAGFSLLLVIVNHSQDTQDEILTKVLQTAANCMCTPVVIGIFQKITE